MGFIKKNLFYILNLFAFLFLIFLAKNFHFFSDDFTMLDYKSDSLLNVFLKTDQWWRPLKGLFYNFFNNYFYSKAWPIMISKILLHSLNCMIIYFFLKKKEKDIFFLNIICFLFFFSQSGFYAVMGIDTVDQLFSFTFGFLSFVNVLSFIENKKKIYILKIVFFLALSLLSKEISVLWFVVNFYTLFFYSKLNFFIKNNKNLFKINLKQFFFLNSILLIVLIIYLILRHFLGATWFPTNFGNDRYDISLNFFYIIKNFFLYFFSIFNPVDNFLFFRSFIGDGNFIYISILLLSVIIIFYYILFKYLKINNITYFKFFLLIVSSIPTIFLGHISELYTYSSIFFLSFLLLEIKKNFLTKFILILLFFLNLGSFINKSVSIDIISRKMTSIDDFFFENKNYLMEKKIYILRHNNVNKYSNYYLTSFEDYYPQFELNKYFVNGSYLVKKFPKFESSYLFISTEILPGTEKNIRPVVCFNFYSDNFNKKLCY